LPLRAPARAELPPYLPVIASLFQYPSTYLGLFAFMVLTGCGLPLPEEVAIVLAGVLSSQGKLHWGLAFAACLAGAIVGDIIMYAIGFYGGRRLLSRRPRLAKLLGAKREASFEEAIERHAFKVLLLSRFMVGVRGPVYLAAGIVRLPFRVYFLCDLVAATLVVGFFFSLSYAFGDPVIRWIRGFEFGFTVVVVLAILAVVGYLFRYHRAKIYEYIVDDTPGDQRSDD
jgi:membrane protein DedA with SNARE-associated domain